MSTTMLILIIGSCADDWDASHRTQHLASSFATQMRFSRRPPQALFLSWCSHQSCVPSQSHNEGQGVFLAHFSCYTSRTLLEAITKHELPCNQNGGQQIFHTHLNTRLPAIVFLLLLRDHHNAMQGFELLPRAHFNMDDQAEVVTGLGERLRFHLYVHAIPFFPLGQ